MNISVVLQYVKNHRRKVISAGPNWMRWAVTGNSKIPQNRQHTFSRYLMKPSENESLHRPDQKMVRDKNFFGCFTPARAPKFELLWHCEKMLTKNRMKLSANESLHCTDYEMVCNRSFFGCFTPGGSPQSSSYDVTAEMTS